MPRERQSRQQRHSVCLLPAMVLIVRSASDSPSKLSLARLVTSSALVIGSPVSNGAMLSRAARACSSGWTPSVSAHPCLFQRATVVKCTGYPAAVIARATLRALGLFWFCQTDFANAGVALGRDRSICIPRGRASVGRTSRPIALAVLKLIADSQVNCAATSVCQ